MRLLVALASVGRRIRVARTDDVVGFVIAWRGAVLVALERLGLRLVVLIGIILVRELVTVVARWLGFPAVAERNEGGNLQSLGNSVVAEVRHLDV